MKRIKLALSIFLAIAALVVSGTTANASVRTTATGSLYLVISGTYRFIPKDCPNPEFVCNEAVSMRLPAGMYKLTINATAAPLCVLSPDDRPEMTPVFEVYANGSDIWNARNGHLSKPPVCKVGQPPWVVFGKVSHLSDYTRIALTHSAILTVYAFGTDNPSDQFDSYGLPKLTISATP